MNGAAWEIGRGLVDRVGSCMYRKRRNVMLDVHHASIRAAAEQHAFHCADVVIRESEICCESDDWREARRLHTLLELY